MEEQKDNSEMTFTGGMSVLPLDDPGHSHNQNLHTPNNPAPEAVQPPQKRGIKRMPFYVLGGFLLIVIIVTTVVILQRQVKKEDVVVTVEGPTSIKSGESATFAVHYINNNPRVTLKDSKLIVKAPEGFVFASSELKPSDATALTWNLGDVAPGTNQTIQITGKFYADVNTVMETTADLSFVPNGTGNGLVATGKWEPAIIPPSLTIDIDAPKTINAGGNVVYTIDVKNTADDPYENLVLQILPPTGLTITKKTPAPDTGTTDTWSFASLASGKTAHIELQGSLMGTTDEQKVFALKVANKYNEKIYTQINASQVTVVAAPSISLTQSVEDTTLIPGDKDSFSLRVKNTGNAGFSNLQLQVDLDSLVLDPQSVAIQNGGVLRDKKIVWDNTVLKELRSLEPNSEFTVTYSLASYKKLTPKGKNFSIVARPSILIGTTIIPGDPTTVKINTELNVVAAASAFDSNKHPIGSGPTVPKVGSTTTYRLTYTVTNMYNEVGASKISCVIPLGATYLKNSKVSEGTTVVFDEPTKTLIWNMGTLKAKTETDTGSVVTGYFDVSVSPSAPDAGKEISLTSKCTFTGHDTYTDKDVNETIETLLSDEVEP